MRRNISWLAKHADDISIVWGQPANSLSKLVQSLEYFDRLSGYKVNMSTTQLLKYNYTPSEEIKTKCHSAWQAEYFKYLGVRIPEALTELLE